VIANVSFCIEVGFTPMLKGLAEESDLQQIDLAGLDSSILRLGDRRWDERLCHCNTMDAVVNLGEGA
jgi:hypothetical protein